MPRPRSRAGATTIKDHYHESQRFMARSVAALVLVGLATLALIGRLFYLQVVDHQHYVLLSTDNRVKIEPLPPTRGLIYDRQGILLADNQPSYSLELTPEQVPSLDDTLQRLQEILAIAPRDLEHFHRLRRRNRSFTSIPLRYRLNEEEVARFAVHRHEFPGVDVRARLYRYYPMKDLTAHVLGYVGRIDEKELKRLNPSEYTGTNHVGKVGVEKAYEAILHGKVGLQRLETNAQGRVIRVLAHTPPAPGADLYLNLDVEIQRRATEALGAYNGAIVIIDPRDGGVLAMVSKPGFDPNPFVNGIGVQEYRSLRQSPDMPLFNRVLRGQYPPGSTVKPFVGLAGLEDGVFDLNKTLYCPGFFRLPGHDHKYRDWKRWGHGRTNLDKAIVESCDVYFYQLALALGIDRMSSYLAQFGFGRKTGVDLVGELPGLLPTREWKQQARKEPWYPGETLISGIGQGYFLATPLQLAQATATLAQRGKRLAPRVVRRIQQGDETSTPERPVEPPIPIRDPRHWDEIVHSMERVIHSAHGTARRIATGAKYRMAGKTGTAQVYTIKQDERYDKKNVADHLRDHALFVGFAPVKDPRVAVAVVVEHGGGGGSVAAPVARLAMDAAMESPASGPLSSRTTAKRNPNPGTGSH